MDRVARVVITIICIAAVGVSWLTAIISKTPAEKQLELIRQARHLTNDGIYILAEPLLEEAAGYDNAHRLEAEEELKKVYLALIESSGYARKYTGLLEKQMNRRDAQPEVFAEAANYQLSMNAAGEALAILRAGIERTGDAGLVALYENSRYAYEINRSVYEEVTAIYNDTIGVKQNGKWGIIKTDGTRLIPCEYEKVSTFHQDRVIVKKNGVIYAVDRDNHRIAVAPEGTLDFRNLSDNRTALLTDIGWRRTTKEFELGSSIFEDIGMHSGGYAPVRIDGKWGVISTGGKWLIEARFDEVIQDEIGRCYGQGAVFIREGGSVYMYVNGNRVGDVYQYARPFSDEGYAAVMRNGKWGFIDAEGSTVIDYIYDDAMSFSGHLAAVKKDGLWGYADIYGNIVIDTVYLKAGSFSGGTAPVLTDRGWQLITLTEYKKAGKLL